MDNTSSNNTPAVTISGETMAEMVVTDEVNQNRADRARLAEILVERIRRQLVSDIRYGNAIVEI